MLEKMMKKTNMLDDIERVLVSKEELQQRIGEVAAEISRDYAGKCPVLVGVLNGEGEILWSWHIWVVDGEVSTSHHDGI